MALARALTAKCAAAAAFTFTVPLPVSELLETSVAVSVSLQAVSSVAVMNVPVPPVNTALAGKAAVGSLLAKRTVPA